MSNLVKAESVTLLSALESALGIQPSTGWRQHQPNADGIQDFYPNIKKVARSPLSKNRQNEKGDVVDLDVAPKLVHDLNKDLLDAFGEGIFLAKTQHTGGTGLAYFTPTAVTSLVYTVAALGALPQGTLVYARGFKIAGNNGLKQVGAASTGTSIPTAGLAAETVSGYLATVEVAGWRGASGDIGLDVNGNLTSTAADFTTMGLAAGMWIKVGGGVGTSFGFANALYTGIAQIAIAPTAHLLTLQHRSWVVGAADTGTTKTIDLYWSRWLINVPFDNVALYQEPSYQLEMSLPGADTAGATDYKYAAGCMVDSFEVNAPLTALTVATVTFCGTTMTDPSTTRATGAATANLPIASAGLNTVSEESMRPPRLYDPNNADFVVSQDVSSWKLTLSNNISPQKQQGSFGAVRMIVGKCTVMVAMECFYVQPDIEKAIRSNNTLRFDVLLKNGDGGVFFDIPSMTLSAGQLKEPANGPVTITPQVDAFRDGTFNYTLGMMQFPYLPAT